MNKLISPIVSGLAVILVLFLGISFGSPKVTVNVPASTEAVGGQYNSNGSNVPSITVEGLVKSNGVSNFQKAGLVVNGKLSFAPGSALSVFTNKTAATIWVESSSIFTSGTSTASGVSLYLFATTSQAIVASQYYTAPAVALNQRLIYQAYLATSSAATTTSSIIEAAQNTNAGIKSAGLVPIYVGHSIMLLAQNATSGAGTPLASCNEGALTNCYQATSTSLGLGNVETFIRGFSTSTEDFNQYQY